MNGPRDSGAFAGRVALVTGGARGLGRAYALRLASLGAAVAVADVDLRSYEQFPGERATMTADSTVAEILGLGGDAIGIEADVGDFEAMLAVVEEITDRWDRLDVAVCNAGGGSGKVTDNPASGLDLAEFDRVLRRNLHGTVHTCMAVVPVMKRQRTGSIVTVSSTEGVQSLRSGTYTHYCVAKAAVVMYTRCLAQELGPFGIRANAIAPGFIATGRIIPMIEEMGGDQVAADIPLRRVGTPEDCARVVEFLAGDLSEYVTGHVLPVEGGWISGGI